MLKDLPHRDMDHEYNGRLYQTGKMCIEKDCNEPAGTAWGPLQCKYHNSIRMDRIDKSMNEIANRFSRRENESRRKVE